MDNRFFEKQYQEAASQTPIGYWESGNPTAIYTDLRGAPMSRDEADILGLTLIECKPSSFARRENRWATRLHDNPSRCVTFDGKFMNCVYAIEVADYVVYEAGWKPEATAALDALPDRDTAPLAPPKAAVVTDKLEAAEREREAFTRKLCELPEAQGKPLAVAKLVDLYYGSETRLPLWRAASILAGLPSESPQARAKAERDNEAALIAAAKKRIGALAFDYSQTALVERKSLAYSLRIKSLEPRRPFAQCLRDAGFTNIAKLRAA